MSTWQDRRYFTSDVQAQTIASLIQKSILQASEQTKVEDDLIQLGDLSDSNIDLYETIIGKAYSNLKTWKLPLEPDNNRCRLWLHATNSAFLRDLSDFGGSGTFYGGIPLLNPGYDDGITGSIQNPTLNGSTHFIKVPDSGNIQIKSAVPTQTGISFFFRGFSTAIQSADGTNVYLFSKIDDDLVTYAYQSFYDNGGVLHFQVIQNGVTYANKTTTPQIAYVNDFSDFQIADFKQADFYANVVSTVQPTYLLVDEYVFTYNFSTHGMQIYKNGTLLTLTSDAAPIVVPPALTPPAVGSAVQLTSTLTASGGTNVSSANDNNLTTRWDQATGSFPMWLQADLGQKCTIIYCEIAWYNAATGRIYNFELYVSDDASTWAKVYTGVGQGTDALQRYEFPDTTGRYVKLNITGGSAGLDSSVWEFDVWGYLPITSVLPVLTDYNVPVTGGDYFDLYQAAQSSSQDPVFGVTGASTTDQKLMANSGTTNVFSNGSGSGNFALSAASTSATPYAPTISNQNSSVSMMVTNAYLTVVALVGSTSSVLYGKVVSQIVVKLKRTGTISGSSPLLQGIKTDSTGGTQAYSSNSMAPSSVSTSAYTNYTFNFSGLSPMGVGEGIGINGIGWTNNPGNFISVLIGNPPDGGTSDGTNTYLYAEFFNGTTTSWGTVGVGTAADPIFTVTTSGGVANHILAENVIDTSSLLYNKAITVFTVRMKKNGSPTGTIYARIRKSGGTTIAADTSLSAASLTTSYAAYQYTFANNVYALQVGDQLEVQFDGGDPSVNNVWVQFSQTGLGDSDYDSSHSYAYYQDTNSTWFYDTTADMSATMAIANAPPFIAVGEKIVDNTSAIYGKTITKITVKMARATSGTTGNINAYILLSGGSTVTSPTTIAATSLPIGNTTYSPFDFDFSSNAHAGAVGDKIYVVYNAGDPTNYVMVNREVGSASGDSVHTIMTAEHPDTSWVDTTTDDIACTFYATTVIPATTTNRVAMYLQGDFATLINHQPNDFTFYLKKLGAPTGTIYFRIRDLNDAIVEELGTYNPASLTTTANTAINLKNIVTFTHLMAKGDKICIEYTGGTTNDRVKVQQNSKSYYANPDTVEYWYNNSSWALVSDRAIAAIINEGGQTVTQQYLDIYGQGQLQQSGYTHALFIGACAEFEQLSQNWVLRQGEWAGVFAEFRVYYGILSQTEITNLYTNKRTISTLAYGEVLAVPNIMHLQP